MWLAFVFLGGSASAQTGLNATVNWDLSDNPDVIGYNVYYGTSSRNYSQAIFTDEYTTSLTISGLAVSKTYFVAVTSVDSFGNESDFSTEAYFMTPSPPKLISQLTTDDYGYTYMQVSTPNVINGHWELDYSTDLVNWNIFDAGDYSAVNDVMGTFYDSFPQMFFRVAVY